LKSIIFESVNQVRYKFQELLFIYQLQEIIQVKLFISFISQKSLYLCLLYSIKVNNAQVFIFKNKFQLVTPERVLLKISVLFGFSSINSSIFSLFQKIFFVCFGTTIPIICFLARLSLSSKFQV
jgi:hypothetical protein